MGAAVFIPQTGSVDVIAIADTTSIVAVQDQTAAGPNFIAVAESIADHTLTPAAEVQLGMHIVEVGTLDTVVALHQGFGLLDETRNADMLGVNESTLRDGSTLRFAEEMVDIAPVIMRSEDAVIIATDVATLIPRARRDVRAENVVFATNSLFQREYVLDGNVATLSPAYCETAAVLSTRDSDSVEVVLKYPSIVAISYVATPAGFLDA